jgi:hypothetical protein
LPIRCNLLKGRFAFQQMALTVLVLSDVGCQHSGLKYRFAISLMAKNNEHDQLHSEISFKMVLVKKSKAI